MSRELPDEIRSEIERRLVSGEINKEQAQFAINNYFKSQQVQESDTIQVQPAFQPQPQEIEQAGKGFREKMATVGSLLAMPWIAKEAFKKSAKQAFFRPDQQTEETRTLPELDVAPLGMGLAFDALVTRNPEELGRILEEQLGPGSLRRDEKGNLIAFVEGKEFLVNKPGFSSMDVAQSVGELISFLPAAKSAALTRGLMSRIGAGTVGSSATQAAIETRQASRGGEFDTSEVALAGAFGSVGELPSALIQSRRLTPEAASLLPDISQENVELARRVKKELGVSLFPSQATGSNTDKLIEMTLSNSPDISDVFVKRFKEQSLGSYEAAARLLNELASKDAAILAASDVSQASRQAIDDMRKSRTQRAGPLFDKAFDSASENNIVLRVDDIVSHIDNIGKESVSAQAEKASQRINEAILRAAKTPSNTNVQRLHNLKRILRNDLDKLRAKEGAITEEVSDLYKTAWESVREKLIKEADGYDAANSLYAELSPAVDLLEGSTVGKIANINQSELRKVSNEIFNFSEFNANRHAFLDLKKSIKDANPGAWNALVRNNIEQNLEQVMADVSENRAKNIPGELYKKLFAGKNRIMLNAALDGEQKKNFIALAEAMGAAKNRATGSQTAPLQEIQQRLKGNKGVATFVSSIVNPSSESLFSTALGAGSTGKKNIEIISRIYTDPDWTEKLTKIRKLGVGSPQGGAAFAQLFREVLSEDEQYTEETE